MSFLFPPDFQHVPTAHLLTFPTRALAEENARSGRGLRKFIEKVLTTRFASRWAFVQRSSWDGPNILQVLAVDGTWEKLSINPCSPAYKSPLHGAPAAYLDGIRADYPPGAPTTTLAEVTEALLRYGMGLRSHPEHAKRHPYITHRQVHDVLRRGLAALAWRWCVPVDDSSLVLSAVGADLARGGRTLARLLADLLAQAAHAPNERLGIDVMEKTAAAQLRDPTPEEWGRSG